MPPGVSAFVQLEFRPYGFSKKLLRAALLSTGFYERDYWNTYHIEDARRKLDGLDFDLLLANDVFSLPIALRLASGRPVMLDAHEYSPKEFEDKFWWRLTLGKFYDYVCRTYLPRAASMTTVCQGIADEYARVYGVSCHVVLNAPYRQSLRPSALVEGKVRVIHHGAALRSRHLEAMIDMMSFLDERFTLDFMLVENDAPYLLELKELAKRDKRIRFRTPVPMPLIAKTVNEYDIGVYLMPPINFNHRHALPNKFFEFIQGGIATAIGPSQEMARLAKKHRFGVVSDTFDPRELASILNKLSMAELWNLKVNAAKAADVLCFETNAQIIESEVKRIIQTETRSKPSP